MSEGHEILGRNGLFHSNIDGFTPRDSQQKMADAVKATLDHGGKLVVESGTGTGKTYAYLVPVVQSGQKTIISTGTKHLQEQIFHRDLPEVVRILGKQTKAALLKGRANYLCLHRLKKSTEQTDLIGKNSELEFDQLHKWAVTTRSGDIAEVVNVSESSQVWRHVTSTPDNCLGGKCPDFEKCFVNKARKEALKSDIVVVNHHLFFSDLTLKTEGFGELLPEHEAVIFDEAHSIVDTAARFFGFSVSSYQLKELLNDCQLAEKSEHSGVELKPTILSTHKAIDEFVDYFRNFKSQSMVLSEVINGRFDRVFTQLSLSVSDLSELMANAAVAGEELEKCYERVLLLTEKLESWREGRENEFVSWIELGKGYFRLNVTPLNVGNHFRNYLESTMSSWIFTSATLAVGDDFSAFCNDIGLKDADTHCWQSPYDFEQNTLMYLPQQNIDPRNPEYFDFVAQTILNVTSASDGRAFCLFTSYSMMDKVYGVLKDACRWPLLLQGQGSKQFLLDQFLKTKNAVLLGTASFWEGVDVKGDALSCVIIDKLPFEPPSDPVLKSKLKICEEDGGSPFMDIQIPNAVISLKQGAGRLIRSEEDRGVLVICDPRVSTKSYGKLFLNSLPPMPVTFNIDDVFRFFK